MDSTSLQDFFDFLACIGLYGLVALLVQVVVLLQAPPSLSFSHLPVVGVRAMEARTLRTDAVRQAARLGSKLWPVARLLASTCEGWQEWEKSASTLSFI